MLQPLVTVPVVGMELEAFAVLLIAALAGGGYVLYSDGFFSETEPDATATASGSELSVTPYVGADGAGGVLRLSF